MLLVYPKANEDFWLYQRFVRDEKLTEASVSVIFVLMLSRIFSEALMSISNKKLQNFHKKSFIIKTLSIQIDASLAFLLHCIENILNYSSIGSAVILCRWLI